MAFNDVTIVKPAGGTYRVYDVYDRTNSGDTVIYPGDPVKVTDTNYVGHLATGDPEIGTDRMVGIAVTTSTETASADGKVTVFIPAPGQSVMRCKVTTTTNADSTAEILGLIHDAITFDLSSTTYTIDENEGTDEDVHGLVVVDGDATNNTLDFVVQDRAMLAGGSA